MRTVHNQIQIQYSFVEKLSGGRTRQEKENFSS